MSVKLFCIGNAMADAQWQRCKGELMALAAIIGSTYTGDNNTGYRQISTAIEGFIEDIEGGELYELGDIEIKGINK